MMANAAVHELETADVIFEPDIGDIGTMDFSQTKRSLQQGVKTGRAQLYLVYEAIERYYRTRGGIVPDELEAIRHIAQRHRKQNLLWTDFASLIQSKRPPPRHLTHRVAAAKVTHCSIMRIEVRPMRNWYAFAKGRTDGNQSQRDLLGGKGANLAEMCNLGISVPPGFTLPTPLCQQYYDDGSKLSDSVLHSIDEGLHHIEKSLNGPKFGDAEIRFWSQSGRVLASRCQA